MDTISLDLHGLRHDITIMPGARANGETVGPSRLQNAGQTFVFMTVSHDGIQQLVGIAGNAIGLSQERDQTQREAIVREPSLDDFWKDAWAAENVQAQYGGHKPTFMTGWRQNLHWIPNWLCPDNFYWWLDQAGDARRARDHRQREADRDVWQLHRMGLAYRRPRSRRDPNGPAQREVGPSRRRDAVRLDGAS